MSQEPEMLIRLQIPEEYLINAVQLTVDQLKGYLKNRPGVLFNFYAQKFGIVVKEFKYSPKAGYFVDINTRQVTHRFICHGIERRDLVFDDKYFQPLVPQQYRSSFFNIKDAQRSYVIPITDIIAVEPINVAEFVLWESQGNVSETDDLHHPRMIMPFKNFQEHN